MPSVLLDVKDRPPGRTGGPDVDLRVLAPDGFTQGEDLHRVHVAVARDSDQVVVSVEDDGRGINPERPPGSGLGTQIVQSLIADLQGRIAWEPATPRGTRARFTASLRPLT